MSARQNADAVAKRKAWLLARYPYDGTPPAMFEVGSPERLRGVPEPFRDFLAGYYARNEARWEREEAIARRRHQGQPELVDDAARRYP